MQVFGIYCVCPQLFDSCGHITLLSLVLEIGQIGAALMKETKSCGDLSSRSSHVDGLGPQVRFSMRPSILLRSLCRRSLKRRCRHTIEKAAPMNGKLSAPKKTKKLVPHHPVNAEKVGFERRCV